MMRVHLRSATTAMERVVRAMREKMKTLTT
jgi:hypothetical protein